jgi:preprotein translocase subunit SecA
MFKRLFGGLVDSNEKEIDRIQPLIDKINALESDFEKLSDAGLKAKTGEFKARIAESTTHFRQEVEKVRQELETARKCENEALNAVQQDSLSAECKDLETQLEKRQSELKAAEKRALEDILPDAFAAVREAAKRTIGQRHFDVQLIGGIVLHQGKIAEMKTGEGKTLVATCPLYLNSLTGRGAHLITVNDYLARRDPYWMGPIYHALGVTVASIYPQQTPDEHLPSRLYDPSFDSADAHWKHYRKITRQEAYQADITYGTSAEFGFDYLRDNMVIELNQCVQGQLSFGIVDEVDNLLIDEARTPLIISGPAEETGDLYKAIDSVVRRMKTKVMPHEPVSQQEKDEKGQLLFDGQTDFIAYEKEHVVEETVHGQEKIARAFGMHIEDLFGGEQEEQRTLSIEETKKINDIRSIFRKSMQAHALYKRDRDYVVNDGGEVIIVDEFTGRLMMGRRYSEGLHQAIEAKEGVKVQRESMTYATITIQNYFRMYAKLAGMTGTAITEAEEFHKIYRLDVVVIPPNKPLIREDHGDRIYKTENGKFSAVAQEIEEVHKIGQPVLVGTVSIEKSERLGDLLKRKGIPFKILNAKKHLEEASVIAEAGKPGGVTVATNMAGRGVDIVLGGKEPEKPEINDSEAVKKWEKDHQEWQARHEKVLVLGGLHVIGTERHEARRIDNQLRGRSGRQGDPGSTRFYVSLDDDVVKRFGGERIKTVMGWVGFDENTPIENGMVSKSIENSQVKVEGFHFDIRKHLVEFDDVVNKQREVIYTERKKVLSGADLKANILNMVEKELKIIVTGKLGSHTADDWDVKGFVTDVGAVMPVPRELNGEGITNMTTKQIEEKLIEVSRTLYAERELQIGAEMRLLERLIMVRVIDSLWIEHLTNMENQRQQAGFAGLQQQKSEDSYKRIGYEQFQLLLETIQQDVARMIFHVNLRKEEPRKVSTPISRAAGAANSSPKVQVKADGKKVGRNDPCPCGSGKKFKHCHGT